MVPDNNAAIKEVIRLLEESRGADVALGEAVRWSVKPEIKRLLSQGVYVDSRLPPNNITPLMLASSPEVARLLVKHGADINAVDREGRTPLLCFLQGLQSPAKARRYIGELIRLGADVKIASAEGLLPMDEARSKYPDEVLELLAID